MRLQIEINSSICPNTKSHILSSAISFLLVHNTHNQLHHNQFSASPLTHTSTFFIFAIDSAVPHTKMTTSRPSSSFDSMAIQDSSDSMFKPIQVSRFQTLALNRTSSSFIVVKHLTEICSIESVPVASTMGKWILIVLIRNCGFTVTLGTFVSLYGREH